MKLAIYGTGGVGGYFGGRLADSGQDVTFIARGDHLRAMQRAGLTVESIHGDFHLEAPKVTASPAVVGPVDVVLVAVKSWQVPEAAEAMRPLMGPDTAVVSLLNGVEAVGQLSDVLGQERVMGGVAKIFSFIERPGLIRHIGHEPTLMLGEVAGGTSGRLERLSEILQQAGIKIELPASILVEIWKKFLFTTGWGGLGAISRAPIGVLREEPATQAVIQACMLETEAVAKAAGIALPDDIVDRTWAFIRGLEATGTSSLQRDIVAGRPSEIDAWNGAVVRMGRCHGVATPTHDLIVRSLVPLEKRARGEVSF